MRKIALFLSLILLLSTCKKDTYTICAEDWEADLPGQWYFGDFHIHTTGASNDTGGDSYPSDVKETAMARGLDFAVLTDHSNSTGSDVDTTYEDPALFNQGPEFIYWDSTQLLTQSNFLFMCGNEISPRNPANEIPTGHVGCIPKNLSTFNQNYVFTDRPMGTVSGANMMQQATEAGCYKILNHPYAPTAWIAYDWTSMDYDAIEIWNGTLGFDSGDQNAFNAWICDLLNGKMTTAVGGSDCHRVHTPYPGVVLDPALASPTTGVFASAFTWDAIIEGLENQKTMVFEGDSRLQINDYTQGKCHANGKNVAYIRLRGQADALLQNASLYLYYFSSCNDPRPTPLNGPTTTQTILYQSEITNANSFDIGVEVNGKRGVYAAVLKGDNNHYWAFSNAIVVE